MSDKTQRVLKLKVSNSARFMLPPPLPIWQQKTCQAELNSHSKNGVRKGKSEQQKMADLLIRQARRAMDDLTECPANTIPAHLARIDDLIALFSLVMDQPGELVPGPETLRSDKQLQYACTVADFVACMQIARKDHRAPAYVNPTNVQLDRMERMLSMIGGAIATTPKLQDLFFGEESEAA